MANLVMKFPDQTIKLLKAKYEEKEARSAVINTVTPILMYLLISKRGHFFIRSKVTPAQKIKKRDIIFSLISI